MVLAGRPGIAQVIVQSRSQDGKGFLGIRSEQISSEKAKALGFNNIHGNYIREILPGCAAEKAGLQPFDYIYGIGEDRAGKEDGITTLLKKYKPGDKVTLHLIRKGKPLAVEATLGRSSDFRETPRSSQANPFLGINRHPDNKDEAIGVRVYALNNSTAREMGLKDGDLITSINGNPMVDWTDISTAINNMKVGENIVVEYERDGQKNRAEMPIKSYAQSRPAPPAKPAPPAPAPRILERQAGNYAFLGIQSTDLSREKARKLGLDHHHGSYVTHVIGNTAAEKAGIQIFDYIYGIDEYRTGEDQTLTQIIRRFQPGDKAVVHLVRKGKKQTVSVTFASRSEAKDTEKSKCEEAFFGIRNSTKTSSDQGIAVDIVTNSTAQAIGMKDGDIITTINDYPMIDWPDITTVINHLKVGQTIKVEYVRNGRKQTASGPIKSQCDTQKEEKWEELLKRSESEWSLKGKEQESIDISRFSITVNDMSRSEAENLRSRHGIELRTANDLQVRQLKIVPNPGTSAFRLEFNLPTSGETTVKIFNASGRKIYDYDLGRFTGHFEDEVNIAQNGPGNYFLEIKQGGKSVAKKIVLK
jgi:S1-C subfamily serine protease